MVTKIGDTPINDQGMIKLRDDLQVNFGYEVQKILAGVDWFTREKGPAPVMVCGTSEGAMLAMVPEILSPPPLVGENAVGRLTPPPRHP